MKFGIYEVEEEYDEKGRFKGYRCGVIDLGQQEWGKLYIKSDGRENYQAAAPKPEPKDDNDNDLDLLS